MKFKVCNSLASSELKGPLKWTSMLSICAILCASMVRVTGRWRVARGGRMLSLAFAGLPCMPLVTIADIVSNAVVSTILTVATGANGVRPVE